LQPFAGNTSCIASRNGVVVEGGGDEEFCLEDVELGQTSENGARDATFWGRVGFRVDFVCSEGAGGRIKGGHRDGTVWLFESL
jgi:hypothetical protein